MIVVCTFTFNIFEQILNLNNFNLASSKPRGDKGHLSVDNWSGRGEKACWREITKSGPESSSLSHCNMVQPWFGTDGLL